MDRALRCHLNKQRIELIEVPIIPILRMNNSYIRNDEALQSTFFVFIINWNV